MTTRAHDTAGHSPGSLAKTRPVSSDRGDAAATTPPPDAVHDDRRRVGGPTGSGRIADTDPAVAEAVEAALDGLRVLEHHTREAAQAFRDDRITEGRGRLAELVETTQTMLRLAVMTAEACGHDLDRVCRSEGLNLDVDTRVAVDHMIEHQLGSAWPELASVLDDEFSPVLGQWRTVFERLGQGTGPEPGGRAA